MIPKIIWQTHEWEYKDLPHNFNRCIQTWKNLNPEWEYRYHSAIDRAIDVRDFDQELYGYYMFADKVTQSDIWRYVVLYQYGGFYTDMDSFCIMPLEYSFKQFYNGKDVFCSKNFYAEGNSEVENVFNMIMSSDGDNFYIAFQIIKHFLKERHTKFGAIMDYKGYDIAREKYTEEILNPADFLTKLFNT